MTIRRRFLDEAARRFQDVGENLALCKFRAALMEGAMALAQAANRYLDRKAPWQTAKTDRIATATTLWTAMTVINCLKKALYPYLPFSCEKLHTMLGFSGSVMDDGWDWSPTDLGAGQSLGKATAALPKARRGHSRAGNRADRPARGDRL